MSEACEAAATDSRSPTRRRFLGGTAAAGGLAVAGLAAGGATGYALGRNDQSPTGTALVPLYGAHQPGIATAAQDRLAFAAFDVTTTDRTALQVVLGQWAAAAAQLMQGEQIGAPEDTPEAPPTDTGEALGLAPSRLSITVGFGPSLFDDRFGLAAHRPAALADLPALPGDNLDPDRSGGDLCVQACADDPQVAFHVIRNFARIARGTAVTRWSQLGFGRTSSTSSAQATPRNLMGFKDGTRNVKAEDAGDMERFVWVPDEADSGWMAGGSYLVARRIRMRIESWDADSLGDQQRVFGRAKDTGAPLTGDDEFDPPDLRATHRSGPVIDLNAHIRRAAPQTNGGMKILRRGYSFTDGIDPSTGLLEAGLFFIAFQRDPRRQFVAIQRQLGQFDLLNEYIQHVGSGLFAVPPGLSGPGDYYGKALFTG